MRQWGQRVIAIALAVGVAGCAMPAKSVQELRAGARVEVVEVARPYAEVAKALEENANACLDKVVVENVISRGYHYHKEYKYTPRVTVGKDKTELLLQRAIDGVNMIRVVEEPPGGLFLPACRGHPRRPGQDAGGDLPREAGREGAGAGHQELGRRRGRLPGPDQDLGLEKVGGVSHRPPRGRGGCLFHARRHHAGARAVPGPRVNRGLSPECARRFAATKRPH